MAVQGEKKEVKS